MFVKRPPAFEGQFFNYFPVVVPKLKNQDLPLSPNNDPPGLLLLLSANKPPPGVVLLPNSPPLGVTLLPNNPSSLDGFENRVLALLIVKPEGLLELSYLLASDGVYCLPPNKEFGVGVLPKPGNDNFGGYQFLVSFAVAILLNNPPYFLYVVFSCELAPFPKREVFVFDRLNSPPGVLPGVLDVFALPKRPELVLENNDPVLLLFVEFPCC